jgi:spore coat protein U-like protein
LALAATDSATFQVTITIQGECEIAAVNDLDFGSHANLASQVDVTTTISVQCNNSVPYSLRLNQGGGASVSARVMTGPGGATLDYALYSDPSRTINWGDTPATDAVAGVGNGSPQPYTVYGRVPAQAAPVVGQFTDTITATVEF